MPPCEKINNTLLNTLIVEMNYIEKRNALPNRPKLWNLVKLGEYYFPKYRLRWVLISKN